MKTPLLLLCTLTISLLSGQSSDWLPKDAVLYYKYQSFGFPVLIEIYEITVEEAISTDTSEIRILSESCNNCGGIDFDAGYFERVSQKLWYVTNLDSTRYLLYDFGAQVGDTVTYLGRLDPIEYGYYVVHSIDTIDFLDTLIAAHSIQSHQEWEYGWIIYEGIGSGGYFVPQYGLADPGIGPLIGYWHPSKGFHCFVPEACPLVLSSEDYFPFPELKTRFYQIPGHSRHPIYAVGFDTTQISGDTLIAFPNQSVSDSIHYEFPPQEDCYARDGGWMFHHMRFLTDGKAIFYTGSAMQAEHLPAGDAFTIETRAELNDSWLAMRSLNSNYDTIEITATVAEVFQMEILGKTDTVKRISLSSEQTDAFDDLNLLLGKNEGLVSSVNFRQLMREGSSASLNPYDHQGTYPVVGIEPSNAGARNLTWRKVWDFEVGDILHIADYSWVVHNGLPTYEDYIWTILSRNNTLDEVTYLIDVQMRTRIEDTTEIVQFSRDTILRTYGNDPDFDEIPGTRLGPGAKYYEQGIFNGRDTKCTDDYATFFDYMGCLIPPIIDACLDNSCAMYIEGLGGGYIQCFAIGQAWSHTLRYYKKGNEEWGTPFDFTVSTTDIAQTGDFNIYPNPVSDKIFIETSEPVTHVRILTPAGMIVIEGQIYQDKILDAGDLPPGLYFIQVYNERERIASQKIIMN